MITFRPTNEEDAPRLKKWLNSPEVMRWFPMSNEREVEDAIRVWMAYTKMEAGVTVMWDGEPCGASNLYIQPFKRLAHQCLFSILIADGYRGKGIGSALLEYQMNVNAKRFNIKILHLEVYEGNPARRLYTRKGFKEFGYQKHFIRKTDGTYTGKVFMQKPVV